ncbi:MAG: hypothetical protein H0T89_27135, partial [Deltaproteobacteria bacterium]|nr:hypothetical protein [Deltaproteobacteria bacterium]
VGAAVSSAVARKEIAVAVERVPADSRVVFTANVGELRRNDQLDKILGKLANHPRVALMLVAAPCVRPILAGSEWVVFAAKSLEDGDRATLIVRGRWRRADVEACFADDLVKLEMQDGTTMLQLPRIGWVDFIDDHTVYLSVREDLAAAQVHALARPGQGPNKTPSKGATVHARKLLARLPADRTIGMVVDGTDKLPWPSALLPAGSDLVTWARVDDAGAALDVAVDTRDEVTAQKLVEVVRAQLDPVFKDANPKMVGRLDVTRDGTTLRIRGTITPFVIGMISSVIP